MVGSLVGLTWFNDTIIGRADFVDVLSAGQSGGIIGPLSDLESAWFTGLFLPPLILAFALLLSSLPRTQATRLTAGILWVIPTALLVISIPISVIEEIQASKEFPSLGDEGQIEELASIASALFAIALVMLVLAWAAYRGRVLGLAVLGTVLAMAVTAIHLVLIVKLAQGTGPERVSIGVGLWLLSVGLLSLAVAGWLLVSSAASFRSSSGRTDTPEMLPPTRQAPPPR